MRLPALLGVLLTGVLTGLLSGNAQCNTIIQVTTGNMEPWAFRLDPTTGTEIAAFVLGPATPPLGTGSLRLSTALNGSQAAMIRNTGYNGVNVNAFTQMGYSTYEVSNSGSMFYTYLSLDVQFNGDQKVDDELNFFLPLQTSQQAVHNNVWQTWNAIAGLWVSQGGFGGATKSTPETLSQYFNNLSTAGKIATIYNPGGLGGVKIQTGYGNNSDIFNGNVDNFWIAVNQGTTFDYNFEYSPEPATFVMLAAGLGAVAAFRRRSSRSAR